MNKLSEQLAEQPYEEQELYLKAIGFDQSNTA